MKRRGLLISAGFALAIAVGVAALRGGVNAETAEQGFGAWSDGFFAAGVFVGGVGLLAYASSDGLFDAIRFGIGKAVRVVLSREKRELYPKTFYDYRMQKRGEGLSGFSAALVGAGCIALGGLFLALNIHAAG